MASIAARCRWTFTTLQLVGVTVSCEPSDTFAVAAVSLGALAEMRARMPVQTGAMYHASGVLMRIDALMNTDQHYYQQHTTAAKTVPPSVCMYKAQRSAARI